MAQLFLIAVFGSDAFHDAMNDTVAEPGVGAFLIMVLGANGWTTSGSNEGSAKNVMCIVVLTALLVLAAVVGRSVTLARPGPGVFFGVWGAVIAANALGHLVGRLIFALMPNPYDSYQMAPTESPWTYAVTNATDGLLHGFWFGWLPALAGALAATARARAVRAEEASLAGAASPMPTYYPPAQGVGDAQRESPGTALGG